MPETEAQLALVPHLDLRTVQHLLAGGKPAKRLYDTVVAVHGVAALEAPDGLALRLLSGFHGTMTERITTAGAVAS